MADDETLLDAFVAIRPDPNFMQAIDGMADEAIARLMQRMGSATIPAPRMAPLNPGGGGAGGGGGRSAPSQLAQDYLVLTRHVEDLNRALRQFKGESGAANLSADVREAANDIEDLLVRLRRGARDADPLGLNGVQQQIGEIEQRFLSFGVNVDVARNLKDQFNELKEQASRAVFEGRLRAQVAQSQIRGLPDADIRQTIVAQTAAIRQQEDEVRRASVAFDGQTESINNLRVALGNLRIAQDALSETQANAAATGRSMNTLSNNAYQLGQAIEDAAVGFSLNGISGAFRGASNNINFLIKDLLTLDSVRKRFGPDFADKLIVGSGIGAAVALLVLPPLLEWLEALNDIESKFEDISDLLNRDFSDIQFRVGLQAGERDFLRSIEKARELRDILQQLGDVTDKANDQSEDLRKTFEGLNQGSTFVKTQEALQESNRLLEQQMEILERGRREAEAAAQGLGDPGFIDAPTIGGIAVGALQAERLAKDSQALSEIIGKVNDLRENLRIARENGIGGISDPDQLRKTVELFNEVKGSTAEVAESLKLSKEETQEVQKTLESSLSAAQDIITALAKSAQEIESFQNQLTDGLTAAQRKIAEFTDTQEVLRRQIAGTANDQTLFTLEVTRSAQEFQSLIEKIRAARLELAPTDELRGLVNQEADAAREALRIETETELLLRQKEVRDQLIKATEKQNNENRRSSLTNFEQYAQQLQKSVLSSDPMDRNTDEIKRLNQELVTLDATIAELNANMRLGGSPSQALRQTPLGGFGNFNALGGALEMMSLVRPENFQAPNAVAEAVRIGVADAMKGAATDIVGAQKQTTEAVKQVKGVAVAQ